MGYLELLNNYLKITEEIGRLEVQKLWDDDPSILKELESLRERQKEAADQLDEYNGVKNE